MKEHKRKQPPADSPKSDLNNLEKVEQILVRGTDDELEELRRFHNLTPEQLRLLKHYGRLREEAINTSEAELKQRKADNPVATDLEMEMGCYRENLEPQVRDAVILLRQKGYSTIGSGFASGSNAQFIDFDNHHLADYAPSAVLTSWLEQKGVKLIIEPDSIIFESDATKNLEQLAQIWSRIAQDLPDLGKPSEPSTLPIAEDFRAKQRKLKAQE